MRLPEITVDTGAGGTGDPETDCETSEDVDAVAGDTRAGTGTARLIGTADGDSTSTDDLDLRGPGRLEWSRWIREGRRGPRFSILALTLTEIKVGRF
jgi:hypothetical protein